MPDVKFSTFVDGLSADTVGGSEKIPVIDTTPFHVTPDLLAAYTIDQLHGAGVITALTDTHQLSVFTSGDDEKIITFANVSAWIMDELEALTVGGTIVAGDWLLYSDGGVLKRVLVSDVTTLVNTSVLDFSTLDAATPGSTDLFVFATGGVGKKITLANLETQFWTDFATYVDGLTENTTVTATDKLYSIQGGTPKWVDPDALSTYFNVTTGDVTGPVATTEDNIPQWDSTTKLLKDGLSLVTTVRTTAGGAADTALATEQAIAEKVEALSVELDIDGLTDIGGAIADVDLIAVDDGAGGTNRKSTFTRVWTWITGKIQGLTAKTTPVGGDILTIQDSEASNALKELTLTNLVKVTGDIDNFDIDGGTDIGAALADADLIVVDDGAGGTNRKSAVSRIWDYIVTKIQGTVTKAVPVDADILMIQDSANSNVLTELTIGNLWDNRYVTDMLAVTSLATASWMLDEDDLASNSATKVPSQQSVKAYVDGAGGVQNNFAATSAPTTTDDASAGYGVGSVWVNVNSDTAYICVDATASAAVWTSTTAAAVGWDGDITDNDFSTGSEIGEAIAGTDEFILSDTSDGDNAKRCLISRLKTYLETVGHYDNIYIDAGAMVSCTTAGAASGTNEYGTNDIDLDYFAFDSGVTEERVQFKVIMPEDWDLGTIKARFYWSSASGSSVSDTVEWGIKAGALSNDDAIDAALGTAVTVSDAVLAANGDDMQITTATSALTIGGSPVAGDMVVFEVYRNTDGTDDMTEDAWLFGVHIQYQKNQAVAAW